MRAFVVRPFGVKEGVDFDRVHRDLIDPAFQALDLQGSTTGEIVQAGNILEDMFGLLLSADLVLADITIHNANAFYELGIRHARRRRGTFLIRGLLTAEANQKSVPFDIGPDRYMPYDPAKPAAAIDALVDGLRATLSGQRIDSPVYYLLARSNEEPNGELPPPSAFREDVEVAKAGKDAGTLALLGEEAEPFSWSHEALRQVGRALFSLGAHERARSLWEKILLAKADDYEANKHLGNIHHRLGNLAESNIALQRVVANPSATRSQRAEVLAQQGRNTKEEWRQEWEKTEPLQQRREAAFLSPALGDALKAYRSALQEDMNDYYPGINALSLQVISNELAGDVAPREREAQAELTAVVRTAVRCAIGRADRERKPDPWAAITLADLEFLTNDDPAAVAAEYRRALRNSSAFDRGAALRQLEIFQRLGLRTKVLDATLRAIGAGAVSAPIERPSFLLFTGHRLDAPGRSSPRFPASKEAQAKAAIRAKVEAEKGKAVGKLIGIAGAASGGDILFHEVCGELGIESQVYLAIPSGKYVAASVQDAGPQWVERFNALARTRPPAKELCRSGALPLWLQTRKGYGIWQRSNRWMLHSALVSGFDRLTMIALWDGNEKGDGPGGTADLVRSAREDGARVEIIDPATL